MRQLALVNPELLEWARQSINMDPEEAARKLAVKVGRLLDWEAGRAHPTINQAREMARVYRRPLSSFYLPKPPGALGFSVPHDYRKLPDAASRRLSPQLVVELRRIQYLRQTALDVAEYVPSEPAGFVGSVSIQDSPLQVAANASRLLGITMKQRSKWHDPQNYDGLNAWKQATEARGVLVMHLNQVDVQEVRGIAVAEKRFPVVAVNGRDSPNGRIFTLVHEFIHLLLGASGISDLQTLQHARTPDQRVEQFCNRIAGEVLVPRDALLSRPALRDSTGHIDWPDGTIEALARSFRVSREVIVRRLLIVGRASQAFYQRKRAEYAQQYESREANKGGPLPMPRRVIRSVGQPFARIAVGAYYRNAISASELAELLGARLKHLPAIEALLEGRNVLTGSDR